MPQDAAQDTPEPDPPEPFLQRALECERRGDFPAAREVYRSGQTRFPDDVRLACGAARMDLECGNVADAVTALRHHGASEDAPLDVLFALHLALQASADPGAADILHRIEERAPDHPRLILTRAGTLAERGDIMGACALLENAARERPEVLPFKTRLAALLLPTDPDRTHRILDELPAEARSIPEAAAARFDLALAAGKTEAAADALAEMRHRFGEHPLVILKAQEFLTRQGEFEAAAKTAVDGAAHHPRHPSILTAAFERLSEIGRSEEAAALVERAVGDGPAPQPMRLLQARLYHARGEDAAAEAILDALADPAHPALARLRASIRQSQRDMTGAIAALRVAVDAAPHNDDLTAQLAMLLLEAGDVAAARPHVERLREQAPEAAITLMADGLLFMAQNDLDGARERLARAAQQDALSAWRVLGPLIQIGDLKSVRRILDALQKAPQNGPNLLRIARLHSVLQEEEAAAAALNAAGAVMADDPRVAMARALILGQLGLLFEAQEAVEALDERHRRDPQIVRLDARCRWHLGQSVEAIDLLLDAARNNSDVPLYFQAIQYMLELGALDRARGAAFELGQCVTPGTRYYIPLCDAALAYARLDLSSAASAVTDAIGRAPTSIEALTLACQIHVTRLDTQNGMAALTDAERWRRFRHRLAENPVERVRATMFGQILNENALKADATARIKTALAQPPMMALSSIRQELQSDPDHTGAASAFCVAARRAGALHIEPHRLSGKNPRIPRVVHQFWDKRDPPPVVMSAFERSRAHSGCEHTLYNAGDASRFMEETGQDAARRAFRRARVPAQKADIFRLAVLAERGGIYLDIDDLCIAPLDPLIVEDAGLIVHQETIGTVGNNFIAVVPKHPVIVGALKEACEAIETYANESIWLSVGPGLLTRHIARALMNSRLPSRDIAVLPLSHMRCSLAMFMPLQYKFGAGDWRTGSRTTPRSGGR